MKSLDRIFDAKLFAVEFCAAIGEPSSGHRKNRSDATTPGLGAVPVGATASKDSGEKVVRDAQLRRKG
jgi:hypothetical protein